MLGPSSKVNAKEGLKFYFKRFAEGQHFEPTVQNYKEWERLVDRIVRAATEEVKAEFEDYIARLEYRIEQLERHTYNTLS